MTVQELINELSKYPMDMKVFVIDYDEMLHKVPRLFPRNDWYKSSFEEVQEKIIQIGQE